MGRRVQTYVDKLRPNPVRELKKGYLQVLDPVCARDFTKKERTSVKDTVEQIRRRVEKVVLLPLADEESDTVRVLRR